MSFMPMNQDEYGQPVLQDISRQRKLADQLRAQSEEPLSGQMVSGIYVAPSWSQYLAKGLKSYQAGQTERDANKKESDYSKTKAQKIADFLKGNQAQTTQQGTTDTSVIPAFTPEQQDRFGSPLQGVERQPVVTSTPNMVTESPEQVQARQRESAYGLISQYGNDPSIQLALQDMNHARDRGEHQADVKDERTFQTQNEEKLYNRNRADKLTDTEAEHKYQDIVMKEQQGFQLTMQDKQFAQQYKLQTQSQGFQAGQQARSQAFQHQENALSRQQQTDLEKQKIAATQGKNKPLTEVQGKAVLYGQRANDAHNILNKLEGSYSPYSIGAQETASKIPLFGGTVGAIGNKFMDKNNQEAQQAQRNFITAVLRQESGATISPSEYDVAAKQYFPQAGDSEEVIKQKKETREAAINGFSTMSSGAFIPKYENSHSEALHKVLQNDDGYLAWKAKNGYK